MLVRDEALQRRQKKIDPALENRDRLNQWCAAELAKGKMVEDWENSPANILRQMGQIKSAAELEVILKKLSAYLHFEFDPARGKKALYQILPDQSRRFLGYYEPDFMPEYSIFNVKEEWVPEAGVEKITRADVLSSGGRAGFKKVLVPWNEVLRGWRTVLVKLVAAGLATPEQIERLVGTSDRPGWAAHTGKDVKHWV